MYSASSKLNGVRVMNAFVSAYNKYGHELEFDSLLDQVVKYDHDKFLQILGTAFENQGLDSDKMLTAMDLLASKANYAEGLPSADSFISVFGNQTSIFEIVKNALSESGSEISDKVELFGKNSLFAFDILTWALPLGLLVAVYVVGKSYTTKLSAK